MNRTIAKWEPSSGGTSGASGGSGVDTSEKDTEFRSSKPGSSGTRPIRVLLADDHPVVRWGLTCCLAPHHQLMVIGEAADGIQAVHKAKELKPDVVLMDIDMPALNGLAATEALSRENPKIKVILLSMYPWAGQVTRILQSGARGFLLKDTLPPDLVAAIVKVANGETCFSPAIARHAISQFAHNQATGSATGNLTSRERDVLIGIAEGLSNKAMAVRLGISARTIETHRSNIMRKLNIRTIAGLTRFAVSHGLVAMDKLKNE